MGRLGPFEENTIIAGDCLDVMREMPDGCVDLIFLDPPYGIGIASWDKPLATKAIEEVLRVSKAEGHLYATCTQHILRRMMELLPWKRIISWCKPNLPFRKSLNEWEWSTEFILWCAGNGFFFEKPRGEKGRDYWRIAVENGFLRRDTFNHPARKPEALLKRIILSSSQRGDLVFDPFIGSGTTAVVADRLGRNFFGCDINPDYVEMALERLRRDRESRAQLELL